jgi:hypothetical protein
LIDEIVNRENIQANLFSFEKVFYDKREEKRDNKNACEHKAKQRLVCIEENFDRIFDLFLTIV